jgi:GrpB-like predicted nucleotidyltransferase (UPF0157 family)
MDEPLGLDSGTVRVVPYDAAWPALFEAEAERIAAAVREGGLPPLAVEHVGSTSVPGLAAKPILDLLAGRSPAVPLDGYVAALEAAGYAYRGENGLPGRHYFVRGEPRSRHLHLVELGGAHWRRHLAFRDALRARPALAAGYAALKHDLAARHASDREAYTNAKTAFVERVLKAAGCAEDEPGGG